MSELQEHIKEERSFLHDLSNYLTIAHGMGDYVLGSLEKSAGVESKEYIRMKKTADAIRNMVNIINDRRKFIKSIDL